MLNMLRHGVFSDQHGNIVNKSDQTWNEIYVGYIVPWLTHTRARSNSNVPLYALAQETTKGISASFSSSHASVCAVQTLVII